MRRDECHYISDERGRPQVSRPPGHGGRPRDRVINTRIFRTCTNIKKISRLNRNLPSSVGIFCFILVSFLFFFYLSPHLVPVGVTGGAGDEAREGGQTSSHTYVQSLVVPFLPLHHFFFSREFGSAAQYLSR